MKPWLSKAAAQLRNQVDDSYRDRQRKSDGWIADERFLGSCANVETLISVFRSSLKTAVSGEGIEIKREPIPDKTELITLTLLSYSAGRV